MRQSRVESRELRVKKEESLEHRAGRVGGLSTLNSQLSTRPVGGPYEFA